MWRLLPNKNLAAPNDLKPKANYPYLLYMPKAYSRNHPKYPWAIYLDGGAQNGNDSDIRLAITAS